jgi:ferric iron reductase protein FhuF
MRQLLDNLARELRAAVLASDHEEASRLGAAYTEALARYWAQLSESDRAVSPIPQQSLELLAWVRQMTLMQHAMTGEQLAAVTEAARRENARALYLTTATLEA